MLRRNLYYAIKPFLPNRLRLAFRRAVARRARRRSGASWPIHAEAIGRPPDWPGWPDGHPFCFVLTHDVEGPAGLARCRELAELEMSLGFRSSFNFIPEGGYAVPDSLRSWLIENGFEVGVHDLHHDGKLYRSRAEFSKKAARINEHLARWNAVGFRSGFMHHNLEWIGDLEVLYDASTFDHDPFEPQPDGVGTIFPFFVPSHEIRKGQRSGLSDQFSERTSDLRPLSSGAKPRRGYVELPYTLVQDSTLFLLLREKTPRIWLQKLAWIVEHQGMGLLNVHPDYIRFGVGRETGMRFPKEYYREFLSEVRERYGTSFWHPLPKDLALWYRDSVARASTRERTPVQLGKPQPVAPIPAVSRVFEGRRAAVVVYSDIRNDPRPLRAARALNEAGMQVDVLCRDDQGNRCRGELIDGLHITTVRGNHGRGGTFRYLAQYAGFLLRATWFLTTRYPHRRYDLVHVHNMPDFLVFSAIIPRLLGARVILDLHDPMPEVYEAIHGIGPGHPVIRILRLIERWSMRLAHLCITPNEAFVRTFTGRGCPPEKMLVTMNTPDERVFSPPRNPWFPTETDGRAPVRILFHGSIIHRHGLDLAVEAVAIVRRTCPEARLLVCGWSTPYLEATLNRARDTGLAEAIDYLGPQAQSDIARIVAQADVVLIPNRRSTFTEINLPTRIFEAIALDRPVVAPDLPGIRDYFSTDSLHFFAPDDVPSMAAAINSVLHAPSRVAEVTSRARAIYARHRWSIERATMLERIARMLSAAPV